jgi:hypothetical protein
MVTSKKFFYLKLHIESSPSQSSPSTLFLPDEQEAAKVMGARPTLNCLRSVRGGFWTAMNTEVI